MRFCLLLFAVLVLTGCDKPQSPGTTPADSTKQVAAPDTLSTTDHRDSTRVAPSDTLREHEPVDSLEPPATHTTIPEAEPDPQPTEPEHSNTAEELAGSCDVRSTEQFCFTYTGDGWSQATAQEHCNQAPESEFAPNACPAEGQVATCVFTRDGDPERELTYTYYEPFDPALAEIACPGEFQLVD